jgi:hypothetical protein
VNYVPLVSISRKYKFPSVLDVLRELQSGDTYRLTIFVNEGGDSNPHFTLRVLSHFQNKFNPFFVFIING